MTISYCLAELATIYFSILIAYAGASPSPEEAQFHPKPSNDGYISSNRLSAPNKVGFKWKVSNIYLAWSIAQKDVLMGVLGQQRPFLCELFIISKQTS